MEIFHGSCKEFGLDEEQMKKLKSITRRIEKASKELDDLGLYIFGSDVGGFIRSSNYWLAEIRGNSFDGGTGDKDYNLNEDGEYVVTDKYHY